MSNSQNQRNVTAHIPNKTLGLLEAYALRNGLSKANAVLRAIEFMLANEGSKIEKTMTYDGDDFCKNKQGISRAYVLRELL